MVLKKEKIYVPKNEKLRMEVIQLYYDIPAAGLEDRWKTMELVTRNYWWPGVISNVKKYVEGYDLCQRMKNRMETLVGNLMINKVSEKI